MAVWGQGAFSKIWSDYILGEGFGSKGRWGVVIFTGKLGNEELGLGGSGVWEYLSGQVGI